MQGLPLANLLCLEMIGLQYSTYIRRRALSSRVEPSFSGALSLPKRASANSFSAPSKSPGGEQVHLLHAAYYCFCLLRVEWCVLSLLIRTP